jgi:hypothetical protein
MNVHCETVLSSSNVLPVVGGSITPSGRPSPACLPMSIDCIGIPGSTTTAMVGIGIGWKRKTLNPRMDSKLIIWTGMYAMEL